MAAVTRTTCVSRGRRRSGVVCPLTRNTEDFLDEAPASRGVTVGERDDYVVRLASRRAMANEKASGASAHAPAKPSMSVISTVPCQSAGEAWRPRAALYHQGFTEMPGTSNPSRRGARR